MGSKVSLSLSLSLSPPFPPFLSLPLSIFLLSNSLFNYQTILYCTYTLKTHNNYYSAHCLSFSRGRAQQCQRLFQVNAPVNCMCLHPNQATLIVGDQSGTIHVWDLTTDHNEQLVRVVTTLRVLMLS